MGDTATLPMLAISACLLGHKVRYDGDDRAHPLVMALARYLPVLAICPETEAGLGVPRPTIRLLRTGDALLLRREQDGADVTPAVTAALLQAAPRLQQCSGLILKARSPSCGVDDTPLWDEQEALRERGEGFLLRTLRPRMPVIDEEGLQTPQALHDFLGRVFAHAGADAALLPALLAAVHNTG